ncbi:MAG: mechanosensitive ion channel [Myxococcales bacterium FL481]|nr:MAG: mechanosensitive ion channel [Myxococcales bacterium FL481]
MSERQPTDAVSELGAEALVAGEFARGELGLVTVLAAGVVLAVLLRLGRGLLDLVPMTGRRRELKERAVPVLVLVVSLSYLLFVARVLFRSAPEQMPFAAAAVLCGIALAAWNTIRDLVNGVFVVAGRVCAVGDLIEFDGIVGRVVAMGWRVLTVETANGDEAVVPYSTVARASLRRSRVLESANAHVFRVPLPSHIEMLDGKRLLRETVMCSHWSSLVREPEIVWMHDGEFEVTAYALDSERGGDIEAQVQRIFAERPGP